MGLNLIRGSSPSTDTYYANPPAVVESRLNVLYFEDVRFYWAERVARQKERAGPVVVVCIELGQENPEKLGQKA